MIARLSPISLLTREVPGGTRKKNLNNQVRPVRPDTPRLPARSRASLISSHFRHPACGEDDVRSVHGMPCCTIPAESPASRIMPDCSCGLFTPTTGVRIFRAALRPSRTALRPRIRNLKNLPQPPQAVIYTPSSILPGRGIIDAVDVHPKPPAAGSSPFENGLQAMHMPGAAGIRRRR